MKLVGLAVVLALLSCGQPSPKEQIQQLLSREDLIQATKYAELPEHAGYIFATQFKADLTDTQLVYLLGGLLNYLGNREVSVRGKVVVFAVEIPSRNVSVTADFVANEVEIWYTMSAAPEIYTKKTYRGRVTEVIEHIVDGSADDPDTESGHVKDEFTRQGKREAV